jgi:hypothetical protein
MSKPLPPVYSHPCPVCHALPGHRCVNKHGNRSRYAHSLRGRPAKSSLPDLSMWYRSMAAYEGQFAKPRPDWLTV